MPVMNPAESGRAGVQLVALSQAYPIGGFRLAGIAMTASMRLFCISIPLVGTMPGVRPKYRCNLPAS